MKYKNTKTGAVIDTPCVVSGGNWIPFGSELEKELEGKNDLSENEPVKETEELVKESKQDEPEENLADFDGITKAQIIQELDAFGVQYDKRANKKVLYDLMLEQGK